LFVANVVVVDVWNLNSKRLSAYWVWKIRPTEQSFPQILTKDGEKRVKTATLVFDLLLPFDFSCHVLSPCGLDFHRHHSNLHGRAAVQFISIAVDFLSLFFFPWTFSFLVGLISPLKFCALPRKFYANWW